MSKKTDAELLKETRKALGLSQTDMARKLGYKNYRNISRIERGESPMSPQARAHIATLSRYETGVTDGGS